MNVSKLQQCARFQFIQICTVTVHSRTPSFKQPGRNLLNKAANRGGIHRDAKQKAEERTIKMGVMVDIVFGSSSLVIGIHNIQEAKNEARHT